MSHAAIAIPGLNRIGGAERQAMLLAKGLRRRGWRVSVVALYGDGGEAATELRDCGVAFTSLETRKGLADPRGWIRFHRWLQRERPDVLHAHLPHAAWLCRWSRLAAPVPVVVDTLHSSNTGTNGRRAGYALSRWMPDHVTAVSRATAVAHLAKGMVQRNHLSILGNGIEVEAWAPNPQARVAARRELGLTDEFLWMAVGRLEPVKDYPALLRAMARLPQNAHLVILGTGPLAEELRDLARRLGLARRVRFLGFQPNVEHWMQAADGFVLSSRWEGLPMVLLEAGACGVPAVATDVPGTNEVIADGVNGWLAQAGDPDSLRGIMTRLMEMPLEKRFAMGECARRRVMEEFCLEAVLNRWERLYETLLSQKGMNWRARLTAREALSRRSAASA
ncbi:MAG TPA: glycosyltransferase [Terracidiphilus sp.]|nr:glycosyltransferase [Terracidiphilus sp.]